MKFSPYSWHEVKPNEEIEVKKGWLRLRASAPAPLYISAQGYEALAGVASSFDLELSETSAFRVEAPTGVRVFYYRPTAAALSWHDTVSAADGEVFTNIDRMTHESGNLLEVRKALRELELARRSTLRDIKAAHARFVPPPKAPADSVIEPPEKEVVDEARPDT